MKQAESYNADVSCGVTNCSKITNMALPLMANSSRHLVSKSCFAVHKVACANYADTRIALRDELIGRILT